MGFAFQNDRIYEMPVFFGPSPVKNPDETGVYHLNKPADVEAVTVMFETDPALLEALLPAGFTLAEPVLSVAFCSFANIGNFAGNSYNLINISTPVRFDGERDHVRGDLILVMYENHAEPIMGGRDLMGYSKIYADIPRFIHNDRRYHCIASDWGFKFLDVRIDLDAAPEDAERMQRIQRESEGKINWKYIQATPEKGSWSHLAGADASYPTFNPAAWEKPEGYPYALMNKQTQLCAGTVEFHEPAPEDMPMYDHIPRYLAQLPVVRYLGAQHTLYNDPADYNHVYRLR